MGVPIDRAIKIVAATVGTGIGIWLASFFGPIYPATFIFVAIVMAFISLRLGWFD